MKKKALKIKDLAAQAGVSPATASRALSNPGLVAEDTLRRVRNAAKLLDYQPNMAARNLRTQKSKVVLLVVRDTSNPFYLDIFQGVESLAESAGYSVLMCNTEGKPEKEAIYCNMLRQGLADGMILMTGRYPKGYQNSDDHKMPTVICLELIENSNLPGIKIDNRQAGKVATQYLIDLGHKQIAHICGPIPEAMSVLRREGYREAMHEAGLAIPEGFEPIGDFLMPKGAELCRNLFKLDTPPTALFIANDTMAFGAICELYRMGYKVPEDVSVIGFDDLQLSRHFFPPLTTIRQPCHEIGEGSMRLLLDILTKKDRKMQNMIEMPFELIIRESTKPVRKMDQNNS